MKSSAAFACTLLLVGSVGWSLSAGATPTPAKKQGASAQAAANSAPAASVTPTPTPVDPDAIVIPGTVLPRKNGGFVSLTLDHGNFRLTFYDAKKQAVPAEASKAAARWNPKAKFGEDRTVLLPVEDNAALKGSRFVKLPFPILVYVTLLNEQGVGTENFVFNFRP